jgi:hypothetical protein
LDGDLLVDEFGDIKLTDSVRQAVRIRLLWFFAEWRFAPRFGVPYFEEILIKNPNLARIRGIIITEAESVDEVTEARNVRFEVNKASRNARITLDIVVGERTYTEEVMIYV